MYLLHRHAIEKIVLWVVAASVVFGLGGAFMKASDGFARAWPGVIAILCFVVGAALLTMAVRADGLSVAYTVGLGLEAIVSVALGRYLYGEHLAAAQGVGVGLILLGVLAVRLG
jgi:multidrug transporter EmrE-like cation transporter